MNRFAIIGQQCSGKSTVADLLFEMWHYGKIVIKFADPIYDTLRALRQKKHRAFMQEFGEMAKRHFGEMVFVDIFKAKMRLADSKFPDMLVVCDDVRRDYEAEAVLECGFKIIYVHADRLVRLSRAKKQGLDFIENHISETQVPTLRQYAHYEIVNNVDDMRVLDKNLRAMLASELAA